MTEVFQLIDLSSAGRRAMGPPVAAGSLVRMSPDRPTLTWFAGWDVRGGATRGKPVAEVLGQFQGRSTSAVETYEFLALAARGFRPPALLTVGPAMSDDPPRDHEEGLGNPWLDDTELRQTWSLLYQRIAETNPRPSDPFAIYLLGVNPPAGATDEDLVVFNDFYTNVHLSEVAERRHALRAVRYELARSVKAPFNGAPRYLAVYEVDEKSASQRRHVGPPYSSGPKVWQDHRTPWRMWFRRHRTPS